MTIKTLLISFICIVLIQMTCLSNGGPVDISHFRKTGNIRLLRKADITLLKENLNIKIVGDYTEIEVYYQLKNNGDGQKVQYGFPVDAYETNWHFGDPGWAIFEGNNDFVEYFKILENEQELTISNWLVDSVYSAKSINLHEEQFGHRHQYTILRKWYSTTIDFKKGETKDLKVLYKLKNTMRDKIPGFSFVNRYTDRHFTYHLTPSGNWGDGIVKEFNLKVDLTALAQSGTEFSINGIEQLNNNNNLYSSNYKNYNLNQSDRINIHYNNSHIKLSEFIKENELPSNIIKSIRSSSNNSTVKNLLDNSDQTTWSGTQGDWIEIEFQKIKRKNGKGNISPIGILALNGDYSNKENFGSSGKLKKARVIVNDTLVFNTEPWKEKEGKRVIHLSQPIYRNVNDKYIHGFATVIADGYGLSPNGVEHIYKIRIEILKGDGNIDQEITLSELYLLGL